MQTIFIFTEYSLFLFLCLSKRFFLCIWRSVLFHVKTIKIFISIFFLSLHGCISFHSLTSLFWENKYFSNELFKKYALSYYSLTFFSLGQTWKWYCQIKLRFPQISLLGKLEVNCIADFFFFWPHHLLCRILAPWRGIKPLPAAVEARSPNSGHQRSPCIAD